MMTDKIVIITKKKLFFSNKYTDLINDLYNKNIIDDNELGIIQK